MSEPGMNDASTDNADLSGMQPPLMLSPGAQLAAYRQKRGWTVEQVASQLNLAPRQVVAIESDDYPSLPGMPIVRGFIRSYAKLLKVDAAPLLATLGGETVLMHEPATAPRKTHPTHFAESRLPSMVERPSLSSKWVIGLLLVLLLGVAIWAAQQSSEVTGLQKSAETQVKNGLAYLSGPNSQVQKPSPAKPEETNKAAAQPTVAAGTPAPEPAAAPVVPAPVAPPPTLQALPAAEPKPAAEPAHVNEAAPSAAKDALVLTAREDSWIEVKRVANKRNMLARLMKAGETETVEINEPVSLVVGNAAGVDASLRGAPLELKANGSNVARLDLK